MIDVVNIIRRTELGLTATDVLTEQSYSFNDVCAIIETVFYDLSQLEELKKTYNR